jgi:hypothetical protein
MEPELSLLSTRPRALTVGAYTHASTKGKLPSSRPVRGGGREGREARRTQEVGLRAAIFQRVRHSSLVERLSNEERTAPATCTRATIDRNVEQQGRLEFRPR